MDSVDFWRGFLAREELEHEAEELAKKGWRIQRGTYICDRCLPEGAIYIDRIQPRYCRSCVDIAMGLVSFFAKLQLHR